MIARVLVKQLDDIAECESGEYAGFLEMRLFLLC